LVPPPRPTIAPEPAANPPPRPRAKVRPQALAALRAAALVKQGEPITVAAAAAHEDVCVAYVNVALALSRQEWTAVEQGLRPLILPPKPGKLVITSAIEAKSVFVAAARYLGVNRAFDLLAAFEQSLAR
jgi:hypothetical protein